MKASRILAGMSAAAFAASLMSMVSVSAATEIAPTDFGAQVYVMGSTNWNWKSVDGSFGDDGTITLTADAADLWTQSSEGGDTLIGDAGVQFYLGDASANLADTEYTTETIEYTIKDGEGKTIAESSVEATLGKKGDDGKRATTTEVKIAGYESDPADFTKLGEITLTATIKDIAVVEAEAEAEYTFPWSEDFDNGYGGDWGSDGYVSNKVYELAPADKNVKVTIDYTLEKGYDYYLAGLCTANGWGKVYDEKAEEKYNEAVADGDEELAENLKQYVWKASSIKGVKLKSSLTDAELEENTEPLLQNDGYFILYESGSLTFELSPEAVNWLATYLGGDDGTYGGSLFQVYGVDITSITIEEGSEEEEEPSTGFNAFEMYTDNWTYQQMSQEDADARGVGFTVTADTKTYVAESAPAFYNEAGELTYGEVPEGTDPYTVTGATVWNVDIDGLADAVGAGTAGIDGLTAQDKMDMVKEAGIEITNVKLLIDGKEFYSIDDDKLLYGDIEGNGKVRLEVYNEYGETGNTSGEFYDADRLDAIFNEANAGTHYAVSFDITGIPEEAPVEPTGHNYALLTESGKTEETIDLKVGDGYDFSVFLTDDGEPVADADVVWAEVDQKDEPASTGFKTLGDVDATVVKTDENGASTITLYAQNVGTGVVSASYTDEDGKEYEVLFTVNIAAADPSSDESGSSSSSKSSSSNGGNSSGAAEGDNNPATGAAALGTVGLLLAGAAMAVSKKKH